MKKIVVAPDSFKGSLSSWEVACGVEAGIHNVFPDCEVIKVAVADGGEGTVEVLVPAMNGEYVSCYVHDPLMNRIKATYGLVDDGQTAVIEMASASGLTLVPVNKRNPMLATSFGTGELIKDALSRGCANFLIGIGGSATNDAGAGMLQALGFRFLDKDKNVLGSGGQILRQIKYIDDSQAVKGIPNARFTVMCDVDNLFYGETGAANVFARQKGADDHMVELLEEGMRNVAGIIKKYRNVDVQKITGSGAAGGLGGTLAAFLNASLKPGIHEILEKLQFEKLIEGADLIITGEGKLDDQTLMGKALTGVLGSGRKQNIPVIAVSGTIKEAKRLNEKGFAAIFSILREPVSLNKAMDKAYTLQNIRQLTEQLFRFAGLFRY